QEARGSAANMEKTAEGDGEEALDMEVKMEEGDGR
ncbi:hypothetical protein PC120_g24492, partial [Phytophthora cactorum]